jgi:hypothetical protein
MSLMIESVVVGGMHVEKTLRGSRRLEPLHFALSSPHDLMGVFGAIVFSKASIMTAGEAQLPESRAVRAQLVGDQQLRCEALFLEYFAHQPECRLRISPTLNEHLEDLAFMVDGAPQIHLFPAIRTTISSRCHRALGRGRPCRSLRAISGPNFSTQRRTVS